MIDEALYWNDVLLTAALDDSKKPRTQQEQGGPTRTSRAAAIVHAAIHDAVNGVTGMFPTYQVALPPAPSMATPEGAANGAAHAALSALYPSQSTTFKNALTARGGATGPAESFGDAVAKQLLVLRAADGSNNTGNVVDPIADPIPWRPNPVLAPPGPGLDPHWGNVAHFVVSPAAAVSFRPPAFPPSMSGDYAASWKDVYVKGAMDSPPPAPIPTQPAPSGLPAARTPEEKETACFWSYDDALGTPIRLYNQCVVAALTANPPPAGASLHKHAQVLALVNLAMADAGISSWEAKYHYNVLRPFQGIQEGFAAQNPQLITNAQWIPLGRPAIPGTSPNFPAYVSGHSTFGAATFALLRKIYGSDVVTFSVRSDQINKTRTYTTFTEAEIENGRSRILLGVHWSWDDQEGRTLGQKLADDVWSSGALR